MELHQVRYFVGLCKTLNFTRAAELCNVTQPALTRAIQKLEDELGGPLFQRERNLTQLTELGRLMWPLLEQTLSAAESAREHASRFRKSELASLRIGLAPTISARVVIASLAELARRIAGLELELKLQDEAQLRDALLQGEADAAFLTKVPDMPERLNVWVMFNEEFRIGLSPEHSLASLETIGLAQLAGQTLLGRRNCDASAKLYDACAKAGFGLRLRHLCDGEEHIQRLAVAGIGLVLVPQHFPLPLELLSRPLAAPVSRRSVVLAVVGGRRWSPALDAFIKLARTRDFATEFGIA